MSRPAGDRFIVRVYMPRMGGHSEWTESRPLSLAEATAERARYSLHGFHSQIAKHERPRAVMRVKPKTLTLPGCGDE